MSKRCKNADLVGFVVCLGARDRWGEALQQNALRSDFILQKAYNSGLFALS